MKQLHRVSPFILWSLGLLLAFYPVFFSGFERVPGDLGDARLTNYLVEHGYRWINQEPLHRELWSPPFFYPEKNTGAYTDILLSAVPFYGCWRILGLDPLLSFQLCFLVVVSLNYWSMFLFLRRSLKYAGHSSAVGSFLFAFASPRLWQLCHFQLQVHFYTIFFLIAMHRLWRNAGSATHSGTEKKLSGWGGFAWVGVACLSGVAQLYASFYLGWFLGIVCLGVCLGALFYSEIRWQLWRVIRDHLWSWAFWGAISMVAVLWMAKHYLDAARSAGYQHPTVVFWGIPTLAAWWSRGSESWFNVVNALVWMGALKQNPLPQGEHAMGLGLVTYLAIFVGLWQVRHVKGFWIYFLLGLCLFLLMLKWTLGYSPWMALYGRVPGGAAIRALCRIDLIALIPFSIALACFIERCRRPWLVILVPLLCVLEQGRTLEGYSKQEHRQRIQAIVEKAPKKAKAIFHVAKLPSGAPIDIVYVTWRLDGIWAALEMNVPSPNGYSGREPPKYRLVSFYYTDGQWPSYQEVEKRLRSWEKRKGLSGNDVTIVITVPLRYKLDRAEP